MKTIIKFFFRIINELNFRIQGVQYEKISPKGVIFLKNRGKIKFGSNLKFNSGLRFNPIGGDSRINLIVKKNARLVIGNNCGMSNCSIFCSTKISIGNNVMIGGSVKIWDTDFHSIYPEIRRTPHDHGISREIIINDNVFIGAFAIVLKGVTIGENSVIAAGSIVSKDIPPNEIWGGIPCKKIKSL